MAYAFVGSGNAGSTAVNSLSISATYAAGETVLVVVTTQLPGTTRAGTVSDGTNTYVATTTYAANAGAGGSPGVQIFKADNVAAGTFTLTAGGGTVTGVSYFRYTGLASGTAQTAGNAQGPASGATAFTGPTLTPASQPAIFFAAAADQNSTPATAGSGWNNRGPLSNITASPTEVIDQRLTSTSATAASWVTTAGYDAYALSGIVVSEASTAVSASSATTDGADTASAAASPVVGTSSGTTDGVDVLAASAAPLVGASSSKTDGADVLSAAGSPVVGAQSAAADGADQLAAAVDTANLPIGASVAALEGVDGFSALLNNGSSVGSEYGKAKRRYVQRVGDRLVVFSDPAMAIREDEPEQKVEIKAIKAAAKAVKQEKKVATLLKSKDYEQMVAVYEELLREQDEQEVEMLLMSL